MLSFFFSILPHETRLDITLKGTAWRSEARVFHSDCKVKFDRNKRDCHRASSEVTRSGATDADVFIRQGISHLSMEKHLPVEISLVDAFWLSSEKSFCLLERTSTFVRSLSFFVFRVSFLSTGVVVVLFAVVNPTGVVAFVVGVESPTGVVVR